MPFSHHSHSGQFCPGHARNTLEEMVKTAIARKMHTFCLSEHMPRHEQDRYPEEITAGATLEAMFTNQTGYFQEACRLRTKYGSHIQILVGFEIDYCRPEASDLIRRVLSDHQYDFFIGSIHHVKAIPNDYDHEMYDQIKKACGGSDEDVYTAYYEEMYTMLQDLRPPIVGHFDLIRLKSSNPDASDKIWPRVWTLMMRNLDFIASYGGLLEINSAALRKGMQEPYPKLEVCQEFLRRGGRFCLSDDSHGIEQVAYGYDKVLRFLQEAGISHIHYLRRAENSTNFDGRFPNVELSTMTVVDAQRLPFWTTATKQ